MSRTFDVKSVECDSSKIHDKIYELETEWLTALLLRAGVSKIMINKALHDDNYSSSAWRDYLFDERGITIVKDLKEKMVSVFQISFETSEKVKIGEWTRPSIVRVKGGKPNCKLELKYWQII